MKNRNVFILVLIMYLVLGGYVLFAQHVEELYSPFYLSYGMHTASPATPMGNIFNPSASGLKQRTTIDLNYISLPGFGDEQGWGHAINLGMDLPNRFGVFSWSGHFISSPFPGTNLGTLGAIHLSFAKDLYPSFLIGLGIQALFGSQSDQTDWALGADIGFTHIIDEFLFFKDFTWGFAFRGIGKGYEPSSNTRLFPRAFTPALGLSFNIIKEDGFIWGVAADASFQGLDNFRLVAGTEFVIGDFLLIHAVYNLDLAEMEDDSTERIPFAVGFSLKFNIDIQEEIGFLGISERGWNKSDIKTNFAVAPLHNGVIGIGAGVNVSLGVIDQNPPKIEFQDEEDIYVSPNLDGIQDDFILPLSITDERYIKGYKLVIMNSESEVVREIENKDERPENIDIQNILDRLVYVKSGITIPESVRWDGRATSGANVEDGMYTYYLEAWDDNGNIGQSANRKVIVDNTKPEAQLSAPYLIFSPNGDGSKDVLEVELSGSEEDLWQGVVSDNAGTEVAHIEWQESSPQSFAWDGKNDQGILVPDGVYALSIKSTDRAGNIASYNLANIIIDTQATPINITIDISHISPNGDNIKDKINFAFDIPVTSGIEKWSLKVQNDQGQTVKTISGEQSIPSSVDYDVKSDSGTILAQGVYKGYLEVLYVNGNNPQEYSPDFIVDLTPPSAQVTANLTVFSPNNDGKKDFVTISQETSPENEWQGEIHSIANGQIVESFIWKGTPESSIDWYGISEQGSVLVDGQYSYLIYSTDEAGNYGESQKITFSINTEETQVLVSTNLTHFSPNADGAKDNIKIIPQLKVTSGVESYTLLIKDKSKNAVKTIKGTGALPSQFLWDGRADNGSLVRDGEYSAELEVLYINGNNPHALTAPFIIDTVAPTVELATEYKLFSPDGDGRLDVIAITQKTSAEELWEGEVFDNKGNIIRSYFWKGRADNLDWDGKDQKGNRMPNGIYLYKIKCTDKAGNLNQAEVNGIEIDNSFTRVFVTVEAEGFSPNDDGYLDSISFNLYVGYKTGIKSWSFELVNKEAGVQKTFQGTTSLIESMGWDGMGDQGLAKEGVYEGVLTVEYFKGNRPVEKTKAFRLDVSGPQLNLELKPEPFSPDNDGVDDELYILSKVEDLSPIEEWKMEIYDPKGNHFIAFSGSGRLSEKVIWDGRSDTGELVLSAEDYKLELTMVDELGNSNTIEDMIPIDVLVIREGDRLKIMVPSITFAPDTADYTNVESAAYEKNMWTLKRLAEIFKKYNTYQILIEGHGVLVYWADQERAKIEQVEELIPLSKMRAEAVKGALVDNGIEASRISTVGIGGARQVVPHGDLENRWKNRRVEFILIKK